MNKYRLGDLLTIKHGYAFKSENYVNHSKFALVTLANISESNNFQIDESKTTFYGADFPKEFILSDGDLVMPLTEQVVGLFGNTAFIPKFDKFSFVLNQRVGKVIPKEDKVDKYYLHYLLATESVKEQIEYRATGTRQRNISPNAIYDVEVYIPKLEIQRKIGAILYSIESKINHNNKINEELESMAKTIYDYWFLQFEFPNEEGKPYKSSGGKMVWNEELKREIPEGWECVKLDEIFNFVKGKIPTEIFCECNETHSIPYLTIEAINNNNCEYCSEENMILTDGEVLMVMDGAASSEVYVGNKGAIGSTFCKLELKDKLVSNELLYLIMKKYELIFKKVNTGSTVPHANKNYINNFKICLPKDNIQLEKMQNQIIMNIKQINMSKCENKELASLRDFILPLLMNGQVGFRELALAED